MPACRGHVGERAVAAVAIQPIAVDAGDEEIDVAVVIVVGGRRAGRVAFACDTGALGDVDEGHAAAIAEQPVPLVRPALGKRWQLCAVGEKDVGKTVTVVIEDGEPAGHRLDHVLVGRRVLIETVVEARPYR